MLAAENLVHVVAPDLMLDGLAVAADSMGGLLGAAADQYFVKTLIEVAVHLPESEIEAVHEIWVLGC